MFFYYEADSSDPIVAAALGTLYGAGNTSFIRLNGTGGTNFTSWTSQNSPVPADEWTNIWTGYYMVYSKNKNNQIYVWGNNTYGQLGLGDTTGRNTPTLFTGPQNFVDMDGGFYHSVAVDSSGQLWTAGYNNTGQLGLGDTTDRSSWTQVTEALDASGNTISLPAISKVFAAYFQTLVLTTDGDVYSCGEGSQILGRSYNSTTNNKLKFVVGGVAKMSVSKTMVGVVKTDGTLMRWGWNISSWYFGGGTTPNVLSSATDWTHIAASKFGFAAVNSNNELYFIGTNSAGEFAGIWPIGTKVNTLTKLTSWSGGVIEDIKFSGNGSDDTIFIKTSDKKLYVSGEGSSGQLGLGTTSDRNSLAESATGVIDFSMRGSSINWIIKE